MAPPNVSESFRRSDQAVVEIVPAPIAACAAARRAIGTRYGEHET